MTDGAKVVVDLDVHARTDVSKVQGREIELCVGVPNTGLMKVHTGLALAAAVRSTGCPVYLTEKPGPYTHWNREWLVEAALELNCSHLLMVDTDVMFAPDSFVRLLCAHKPIVGAPYNMKALPLRNTFKMADPDGNLIEGDPFDGKGFPDEPFRVYAVATGLILIDLAAIACVPRPLFPCVYGGEGEDIAFCRKANEAGVEVWCDPTVKVGHIGDYTY